MPVRSYGPRIVKKSRPGKHPRWKKSDLQVELERVARDYKGSTLSKTVDLWLDHWPARKKP